MYSLVSPSPGMIQNWVFTVFTGVVTATVALPNGADPATVNVAVTLVNVVFQTMLENVIPVVCPNVTPQRFVPEIVTETAKPRDPVLGLMSVMVGGEFGHTSSRAGVGRWTHAVFNVFRISVKRYVPVGVDPSVP